MERDFPVGHPAACDFDGETYRPPVSPFSVDYPEDHPARGGKNVADVDTPDGKRAAHNAQRTRLLELAMLGSIAPVIDPDTQKPVPLTPAQLAHVYAVRKGLSPDNARYVTEYFNLEPEPGHSAEPGQRPLSAEEQCVMYFVALGYTPERGKELFERYGNIGALEVDNRSLQ
jgi:hypothetical protein